MRISSESAGEGAGGKLSRQLTLFDAVMLVVSGTIGSSIFIVPSDVLRAVPRPLLALLLWAIAGGITLMAGLACAELGGMFPEAGGQYVFIREAYGGFAAFLYGWVLFTAGNSAGLAAMAISFSLFLGRAFPSLSLEHAAFAHTSFGMHWELGNGSLVAIAAVILLTGINLRSVKMAARLQNVTAVAYLAMVAGIVAIGFLYGRGSWSHFATPESVNVAAVSFNGIGIAMIALVWTYDGWEYVSWMAGEIENPKRNLPLALMVGIVLIIATYLLVNVLFLYALAPGAMVRQAVPADAAMAALFSQNAGREISFFISLICFGAASVVVLSGARVYYSMACDGVFFQAMKQVHARWHTPVTSLVAQCIWVVVLIVSGRYEQLYTCFVFMMTLTYVLTVGALFVLRRSQPDRPRPYRCFGYPWLPIGYMVVASGLVVSTLLSRPSESLAGLALASLGVPLYTHWRKTRLLPDPELPAIQPAAQQDIPRPPDCC